MTINFINDDYKPDYVFMGNAKRYSQFFNKIYRNDLHVKVICTSNVSESNKKIDYKFNFNSLINEDELIRDNPVLMLLKILFKIQFLYCNDDVVLRNEAVKKALGKIMENIKIKFLTPSLYV